MAPPSRRDPTETVRDRPRTPDAPTTGDDLAPLRGPGHGEASNGEQMPTGTAGTGLHGTDAGGEDLGTDPEAHAARRRFDDEADRFDVGRGGSDGGQSSTSAAPDDPAGSARQAPGPAPLRKEH